MYAVIKNDIAILITPYLAKARIAAEGRHPCHIFQFMEESRVLPRWDAERIYRLRELEGQNVDDCHE